MNAVPMQTREKSRHLFIAQAESNFHRENNQNQHVNEISNGEILERKKC